MSSDGMSPYCHRVCLFEDVDAVLVFLQHFAYAGEQMRSLKVIFLEGNPLEEPPREIILEGAEAAQVVLDYLRGQ